MKYPTTRFVFDRKKQATKTKKALVQVEILLEGKKKYITTGVKLYIDQWDKKMLVKNSIDANEMRERMMEVKGMIDEYINSLIRTGKPFLWDGFDAFLRRGKAQAKTFVEFVEEYMETRKDIRESTRKAHRKLCSALHTFGEIVTFDDLAKGNIMRFDDFLHSMVTDDGMPLKQPSVYNYHKLLKAYINEAIRREYIDNNPYAGLRFDRGEGEMKGYLTEEEIERLEETSMPNRSLESVRDMFLLQCYTGMAYSDLADFGEDKVDFRNGKYVLCDERNKTGKGYYVVLLQKALDIINKYEWKLPVMTNQQYNMRLKIVAMVAGINKPITTHYARRSAGMMFLNAGMSIEVVSRILGHGNIRTTQKAYAKILDKTIDRAFEELESKMRQ